MHKVMDRELGQPGEASTTEPCGCACACSAAGLPADPPAPENLLTSAQTARDLVISLDPHGSGALDQ